MDTVPLRVLSFFCLSMLYLITFVRSMWTLCKFPSFIAEAKIAKIFYVTIFVLCLVRSTCFGIVTVVFVEALETVPLAINATEGVEKANPLPGRNLSL